MGADIMRVDDWPELLDKFIRENDGKKYEHGRFDCVLFGAGIIKEMTGVNILDGESRGSRGIRYKDKKTALALLKRKGGLFKMTSVQMQDKGFVGINPRSSQRGDIVGFMTKAHGETIGVCVGADIVSPGEKELVYLPMTEAVMAWRIG